MKDKQLREEFEKFKHRLTGLVWDSESASYRGSTIGKIYHAIEKLEHELKYENELNVGNWIFTPKRTILGRIIDLEKTNKELLENQKLIIDYLGIEKVEEPSKTFYKKKEKEQSGRKICGCK